MGRKSHEEKLFCKFVQSWGIIGVDCWCFGRDILLSAFLCIFWESFPFLSGKCILRGKGRDWMNFCGIFICQGRARSSRSIGKLVCSCPWSFLGVIDFIEKNFHLGSRKRKSLFDVLFYRKEREKKWINKFKNNLNYYLRKNLAVCLYRLVINICREFLSVISLSI